MIVHLLAAVLWIGGMMFLSFILVPVFKRGTFGADHKVLFQTLARRFRITVWGSITARCHRDTGGEFENRHAGGPGAGRPS